MKVSRTVLKVRYTGVIAGIAKHIASPIMLDGTTYTAAELQSLFRSQIAAFDANDALRKSLSDGVQKARTAGAKADETYELLRKALIARYGKKANALLNDFGMTAPMAAGARTIDAKVTAVAKRAATRAARHTLGAAQKKGVKGGVIAIAVTPVVAGPSR